MAHNQEIAGANPAVATNTEARPVRAFRVLEPTMRYAILACLLLTGCQSSPIGQVIQADRDARDAIGDAAVSYICDGMTLREWRAKFGRHQAAAQGWAYICAASVPMPTILEQAEPVDPEQPAVRM